MRLEFIEFSEPPRGRYFVQLLLMCGLLFCMTELVLRSYVTVTPIVLAIPAVPSIKIGPFLINPSPTPTPTATPDIKVLPDHQILPSGKGWDLFLLITAIISCLGTVSTMLLGWRTDRRQMRELILKVEQQNQPAKEKASPPLAKQKGAKRAKAKS